jgi:hypothetical protein
MYDRAEKTVVRKLRKKGYLTWEEFDQCLQKEFDRFEKFYMEKHKVDPFSEEFVDIAFDEYETCSIRRLGLRILIPSREEAERMGGGLVGSNDEILEKTYRRLKRRIQAKK